MLKLVFLGILLGVASLPNSALLAAQAATTNAPRGGARAIEKGPYNVEKKLAVRERVRELFYHGYNSYMIHAFPADELKPLSCKGDNSFGGYSLTLVDTLDMLALVEDHVEFMRGVRHVIDNVKFSSPRTVSVFETTIRVLGGIISAHYLALKVCKDMKESATFHTLSHEEKRLFDYDGELVNRAVDLADRLLPAFNTPTGIPFNEIDLVHGTSKEKGHTTCPAGAGSLLLEFGALSVLTGNCTYVTVAERALDGVWRHRSGHSLVGSVIDVFSGRWVNGEASIGASIDSFYEYMVKAYITFGEQKYLDMWYEAYKAVQKYTYFGGWYLTSSVEFEAPLDNVEHKFNSLQAFWPGLQVLAGDIPNALDSYAKMHCVVDALGIIPEYMDLGAFLLGDPKRKRTIGSGYPLRPEFLESTVFLYRATLDDHFLYVAERFIHHLERSRQRCGFAAVVDVYSFAFEDKMDSFVLTETFKYLYMLFTPTKAEIAVENERRSRHNTAVRQAHGDASRLQHHLKPMILSKAPLFTLEDEYVVNTEAHPVPVSRETQSIFKQCRESRLWFQQPLTDLSKVSAHYRAFPATDRLLNANAEDRLAMCRPVDYMRDVAPFIKEAFYTPGSCVNPPKTRILGRQATVYAPKTSYDVFKRTGGLSSGEASSGLRTSGGDPSVANVDVSVPIHIDEDPLVPHSFPLKVFISTKVSLPASRLPSWQTPSVLAYHGIYSIPLLKDPEALFLPLNTVFLRLMPLREAGRSLARPYPDDVFVQTSNAVFGAVMCPDRPRDPPTDEQLNASLSIAHTGRLYRALVSPEGCTPNAIGDTSLFLRPFGLLLQRGGCTFKEKVLAAQDRGASFVVVANNNDDALIQMGDAEIPADFPVNTRTISIPAVMVRARDVQWIGMAAVPPNTHPATTPTVGSPVSDAPLINMICARSAVEQYRFFGVTLKMANNHLLAFRHRHEPLIDTFFMKIASEHFRHLFIEPRLQCERCQLSVSTQHAMLPDLFESGNGFFGASFSKGRPSKDASSSIQFTVSSPNRPISAIVHHDHRLETCLGVSYFFTAARMGVAEVRELEVLDMRAFSYYNNRLGNWLEQNGLRTVGLGAHFQCIVHDPRRGSTTDALTKSKIASLEHAPHPTRLLEINMYANESAREAFHREDFEKAVFSTGHALWLIRSMFITKTTVDVFDQNDVVVTP